MLNVLFVDDDLNIQKMVNIFLRNENFKVTFAVNGRAALRAFETKTFDIIITDLQMPEMDGLTFTEMVRKTDKNIPIIVTSAFGQESMAKKAKDKGVSTVIAKPFDSVNLIAAIRKYIK
jgi:CheY-like chemotaxis protein